MTPQEMVYRAAQAAGALGGGSFESRTDHAAVEAEVRARLEAGLRVDDSVRAGLRFKYTTAPALNLNFERRAYDPATGDVVTRTDQNALTDFTANLRAQADAARAGESAAVWAHGEPVNERAREFQAAADARMVEAQARMAELNAHLPRGYPR
jgi:hypothetical protein